jgi:hypothetical protein
VVRLEVGDGAGVVTLGVVTLGVVTAGVVTLGMGASTGDGFGIVFGTGRYAERLRFGDVTFAWVVAIGFKL